MSRDDPLAKPKDAFDDLIAQLSSPDSPVGIDAQYTHAVIIDYLRQITARLDDIDRFLAWIGVGVDHVIVVTANHFDQFCFDTAGP